MLGDTESPRVTARRSAGLLDRRRFLLAAAAFLSLPTRAFAVDPSLRGAAKAAWLYGLPLIEMADIRWRMLSASPGARANAFLHARLLSTPARRIITTPNTDLLYSVAWLDLSAGPVRITMPANDGRYFSLALMDMFTNNFAVLGPRTPRADG